MSFRIIRASKDAYITNKILDGHVRDEANTGKAGTLDLFKLYNETDEFRNVINRDGEVVSVGGSLQTIELSRILVYFDLSDIENLWSDSASVSTNKVISADDSSFRCRLRLRSVYGGQTTPSNFSLRILPLNKDFEEGLGTDIGGLSDYDIVNWINASESTAWEIEGAGEVGDIAAGDLSKSDPVDAIENVTTGSGPELLEEVQYFEKGTEDLLVDVTIAVKNMLNEQIPNCGFRISFIEDEENDEKTRFIKRFGSAQAGAYYVRPELVFSWNSYTEDNKGDLYLGKDQRIYFVNYVGGTKENITASDSSAVDTGDMELAVSLSDESYSETFSVTKESTGVFYADVNISPYDSDIKANIKNEKVKLVLKWQHSSITNEIYKEETVYFKRRSESDLRNSYPHSKLTAKVVNGKLEYYNNEETTISVFLSDLSNGSASPTRIPQFRKTLVPEYCHLRIIHVESGYEIIGFDKITDSTKLSVDSEYLNFHIDMNSLFPGLFRIDLSVKYYDNEILVKDIHKFRILENLT